MIKEKENIRECLKNLDMNNKFVPFTFDKFFKAVMKSNRDIFKDFLIRVLELDEYMKKNYIMFMDEELAYEYIKEHGKVIDINIKFGKGLLIDVEVNREEFSAVKDRNDLYLEKLDIVNYKDDNKYQDIKKTKIYQLNINASDRENKSKGKSVIVEYDVINKMVYDDRKKKYNYNLVHYYNKWYNKNTEMTYVDYFLAALYSESYEEIYDILSNIMSKSRLNKFMEGVINMVKEGFILHEWEKEKMDKMVQKNLENLALERGKEEGKAEGIAEGIESNKVEMIRNLLCQNVDYNIISNASGKSLEEIKEIEESMKEEK